jgi:hypothetical protein
MKRGSVSWLILTTSAYNGRRQVEPDALERPLTAEVGEVQVVDDAAQPESERIEDDVLPIPYSIVAYGADFDVTSLVKRLEKGDIEIPNFQRGFVWNHRQASRFIESLLIGFPVPGIFLWRNPETERLVVVDGQQGSSASCTFTRASYWARSS